MTSDARGHCGYALLPSATSPVLQKIAHQRDEPAASRTYCSYSDRGTGTTISSPQWHLYVRTLRPELGSMNEDCSDAVSPHFGHFGGGWLFSTSSDIDRSPGH